MLSLVMIMGLFAYGNGGGECNPKDHYNEVSSSISQQQDCRLACGGDDGHVDPGGVAAREEDLRLHLFFFNQSTTTERYGEGAGKGLGWCETKGKF